MSAAVPERSIGGCLMCRGAKHDRDDQPDNPRTHRGAPMSNNPLWREYSGPARLASSQRDGERGGYPIAAATFLAAAASSESVTLGSTSSQIGRYMPRPSSMPSGRGRNHT